MKLDIFDIDKFVEANHCKQVTDPIFFDGASGNPREGGLFSYDIFGMTDAERRNLFGYIDLGGHYLHPLVFSIMSTRMGSLRDVLAGRKSARIIDNKLVICKDGDDGNSGIDFIYDNWEKIDWINDLDDAEIDSVDKKTRLKFLKSLSKSEAFCTKWLVLPVFYRDMKAGGTNMGSEINETYKSLIAKTNSMKIGGKYSIFGNASKYAIQELLVSLFTETTRHIKGKNSTVRKSIIGKALDYSASNVITSPRISATEHPDDMPVKFGYAGFPIPTLLSLFQPFFVNKIVDMFNQVLIPAVYSLYGADIKRIEISNYNTTAAEKLIKMFIKAPIQRSMPITVEYLSISDKVQEVQIHIYESEHGKNQFVKRPFTLGDLLYLSALEVCEDKHVYVTRHPITNIQNIYPCKIKVMSTIRTHDVDLKFSADQEPTLFKNYPYIKYEGSKTVGSAHSYDWQEVLNSGNIVLKSLGGDYDG